MHNRVWEEGGGSIAYIDHSSVCKRWQSNHASKLQVVAVDPKKKSRLNLDIQISIAYQSI